MKTLTLRIPDVEAAMLVEVQKSNKTFRVLQGLLLGLIRQEYQKPSGSNKQVEIIRKSPAGPSGNTRICLHLLGLFFEDSGGATIIIYTLRLEKKRFTLGIFHHHHQRNLRCHPLLLLSRHSVLQVVVATGHHQREAR
jgi:hypothetical protein